MELILLFLTAIFLIGTVERDRKEYFDHYKK